MNIQYYGDYCFKIIAKPGGRATEDITIWTDPCHKSTGLRPPQGQADIVFISHGNDIDTDFSGLRGTPIVIKTPGEYAAHGINASGIASFQDNENGETRGQNTLFVFQVESINCCFLGAIGHELSPQQLEKIDNVDILFIPIGGKDTADIKHLDEMIRKIEPTIIIPMHYKMDGLTLSIEDEKSFCNEVGNCPAEKVAKLNIKKKDLEGKNMEIVLFERS